MNQLDFAAALWASHNANRANKQAGCPNLCLWWRTWTKSHLSASFCFTLSYCFLILSPLICYYLFNCLVLAPCRLGSLFILQMVSLSFSRVVSVVAWWLTCVICKSQYSSRFDYESIFSEWFFPEFKLKCRFNSSSPAWGGCVELPYATDGNNGAQQWWIKLF